MPKFLTLMNPNRRRRSRRRLYGAALAAHQRKSGRRTRRRVRRNPSVATSRPRRVARRRSRPSPPKMTTAMRAKISRAVKAANRRRHANRSPVRRAMAVFRRSPSPSRRRVSRGSFSGGSLISSFKSALSKDLLLKAGGAVGASVATGIILNRWGSSLPGSSNKWGRAAYQVAIPITLAFVVRKKSRPLAEGMVIGALVMGINTIISQVRASAGGVANYPGSTARDTFGVAGELGRPAPMRPLAYYPGGDRTTLGVTMTSAFSPSAW